MKKPLGIILIIIGTIMLVYTGFSYITTKKVVDIGTFEINAQKNHTVKWPPIVGLILIIGGIVVIAVDRKNTLS